MALVATRCTQCGANITVDDSMEKGLCEFCGTEFITQKVVNHTHVTKNFAGATINMVRDDIDNLLKIAEKSLKAKDGPGAMERLDKVLEIEPTSAKAWLMKMQSYEFIIEINNLRIQKIIQSGEYAIQYAAQEDKAKIEGMVYHLYISIGRQIINLALQTLRSGADIDAQLICENVITLKEGIPLAIVRSNNQLQLDIKELAIHFGVFTPNPLFYKGNRIERLFDGLPESMKSEILSRKRKSNRIGCIIGVIFLIIVLGIAYLIGMHF